MAVKVGVSLLVTTVIAIMAIAPLWLFVFRGQPEDCPSPRGVQKANTAVDLGITYLTLTPGISDGYGLDVDSGALVTEVVAGSTSDRAGVRVGDVIVTFNGVRLDEGESLLGMMRQCPSGIRVETVIWRAGRKITIEFIETD